MRSSFLWAILITFGLLFLACAGLVFPIDFLLAITFGWVMYLYRVVPRVSIDGAGILTAVLCLALFVAGSHAFLRWFHGQFQAAIAPKDQEVPPWKARWTVALSASILLLFVAGISAAGIAHQLGWLLTSGESLLSHDGARMAARRAQSTNNLKQIGLGLYNYHEAYASFPPGGTFDAVGRPLHGWQTLLLPFTERKELFDQIDLGVPWDHPRNAPAFRTEVLFFLNPPIGETKDRAGHALSHYAGNALLLGGDVLRTMRSVADGADSTILAGEIGGDFKPWGYPMNWRDPALGINRSPEGFGSPYPGGANFLFVDGSVRFIKNSIDLRVLQSLGTPAGFEKVSSDAY